MKKYCIFPDETKIELHSILDVTDTDGNKWYEVDYLAQDTVYDSIKNTNVNNLNLSQKRIMKEEQNSIITFGCMVYLISSYASALENKTSYLHFKGYCSSNKVIFLKIQ
jgi:hypothetical protein